MGGVSSERDISLKSGKAIVEALQHAKLDAVPVIIDSHDPNQIAQTLNDNGIAIAFIALHGKFGEDGEIQQILEDCRIPYTGSGVEASRRAFDKIETQNLLKKNNISVPSYVSLNKGEVIDPLHIAEAIGAFPFVVKPAREGSSIGVCIVHNEEELAEALDNAHTLCDAVLIEQCIKGRELTVGILGEEALPVVEICPKQGFFDFDAKYTKGATEYFVPADIPEGLKTQLQDTALEVHRLLGCEDFSRVDFMADDALNHYVLELNTIPGFTATSLLPKAAGECGINFEQLCIKLLEFAYAKKERIKGSSVR